MRILHVFRGPVGGLFRHVCDLVRGQHALGHEVGILCDSSTGGKNAEQALAKIAPLCALGIVRLPMSNMPNFADFACIAKTRRLTRDNKIDVIHGHGAKGGLYARLAAFMTGKPAVYTPHGGSLHYNWSEFPGFFFVATEWILRHCTAGFAFVCDYERNLFTAKIGVGKTQVNMVHNGLWADEFKRVDSVSNVHDILFVGELCHRKGVDILINAVAELKPKRRLTVALVGDGPDTEEYKQLVNTLELSEQVFFLGRLPIAQALPLGRLFVLPSRAESFPYVILEAIAAARPTISTKIAGIVEVLPESLLYQTEDVSALTAKLRDVFENYASYQKIADRIGAEAPQHFSAENMVRSVTDFYAKLK
jgi:glycosyltransferase involved in cell wall biosynthesis